MVEEVWRLHALRRSRFWHWRGVVLVGFALLAIGQARMALAQTMPFTDDEIVYLDPDGVIRVFDPRPPSAMLYVDWASPDGGWQNIALGDFTGDGDMEIVAIRQEGEGGRLTLFDPVAQHLPDDRVERINDVPWAVLYDLPLPRPPLLLATGEFDLNRNGNEILYSYTLENESDRFVVLRQAESAGTGESWEEQRSWELVGRWSAVATGNVDNEANIDEVGLVSFDRGELAAFRIEPEVTQFFSNVNLNNRWSNVAFGQFVLGEGLELGAVRDADLPLASAWVFRYNGTTMVDQFAERLSPSPNVLFFGDFANNGDEELVLLRQLRPELGPRPRLVLRDNANNDFTSAREDLLDGDNEYKGGDAGDVDGDGRDEIVIIRNNRIRIYTDPAGTMNYQLIERNTNGQHVKVGNVDADGLTRTPYLVASSSIVSDVLAPGETSNIVHRVAVQDGGRGTQVPFTTVVQGAEGWATVTPSSGVTSATLSITFDASGLQPGVYSGRVVVDAQPAGVQNDPFAIDLELTVESVVAISPARLRFFYYRCEEPPPSTDAVVAFSAPGAYAFTAEIEGNPAWVTASPTDGTLPAEITVRLDPAFRPDENTDAALVVTVDLPGSPGVRHRVPIDLICVDYRVFAPMIAN
ncbi:MAG: hypothetical protein IT328_16260 [Caldilineaceae bacterium]|nr:hypothetical protein [Caldilineaceae bacterium]